MKRTAMRRRALLLAGAVTALAGAGMLLGGTPAANANHCGAGMNDPGEFMVHTGTSGGQHQYIALDRASGDVGGDGNLIVEGVNFCADSVSDFGVGAGAIDDNTSSIGYQGYVNVCTNVTSCISTGHVGFELSGSCVWYGKLGGTCSPP